MGQIPKSSAGYVHRPGSKYVCSECPMSRKRNGGGHGCAWFGESVPVSSDAGSCIYWGKVPKTAVEIPWIGTYTKQELGYEENKNGFSCARCEYFVVGKDDCRRVDKDSPGDTPGKILPDACSCLWSRDSKRGTMATTALVQLIAKPPQSSLKAMATSKKK